MVAGQGVLSGALDVGALTAVETRLEARLVSRGAAHVADLRDALELHRVYDAAGMGLSTVAHLALVLRCSELRAGELLADARMLLRLPGAFEAVAAGLLTVEGSQVLTAQLAPLDARPRRPLRVGGCRRARVDVPQSRDVRHLTGGSSRPGRPTVPVSPPDRWPAAAAARAAAARAG